MWPERSFHESSPPWEIRDCNENKEFQPDCGRGKAHLAGAGSGACPVQKSSHSSMIEKACWQVGRWDSLAEVRVQEGEPLENALRRFKRKVQQEDIIKEVKRHSFYLKPGEKRRVKEALARKRNRKKARKEAE